MRLNWESTYIKFLPVTIKNLNGDILGEYKSYTELKYKDINYYFEFQTKPISKIFTTPNETKVVNAKGDLLAKITDSQWVRPLEIKLEDNSTFTMAPSSLIRENFVIKHDGIKIGVFKEQLFAHTGKGFLDIEDSYNKSNTLMASILYMGLYKIMTRG